MESYRMDGIFRLMQSEEWALRAKQIERVQLERKRAREVGKERLRLTEKE